MAPNERPLRADAARNRGRILEAARAQIRAHGPDVGMDEIATAAGVAVGTLYRHYPTKSALIDAVIADHTAQAARAVESACARVDAGASASAEVIAFLADLIERAAENRIVKAAAAKESSGEVSQDELRGRVALAKLITSAQNEGGIAADVTVDDVHLLFASAPTDRPLADRQRWLDLILPGLTSAGREAARTDPVARV